MKKYANIFNRVYESGNVLFVVRIHNKKRRFSISFHDQDDAKEWLEENYYRFFQNPEKYFGMKKKKWL